MTLHGLKPRYSSRVGRAIVLSLSMIALVVASAGSSPAQVAEQPRIALISPVEQDRPPVGSDKPLTNGGYIYFKAWSAGGSASEYRVSYVIEGGGFREEDLEVGGDHLWEKHWQVPPEWPDGPYTVRVVLQTRAGEPVAEDSMVFVASGADNGGAPPLDAVRMGGPWTVQRPGWAFYDAPVHGLGAAMWVWASEGTEQVRVLYSTAPHGSTPGWVECGNAPVEFRDDYPTDHWIATPRCLLATGDSPRDVTGLAAVANGTPPPAAPDPVNDGGSDAWAGLDSYRSRPSEVALWAEGAPLDTTRCHLLSLRAHDQRRVPLWHANVDFHLRAPPGSASFAAGHYDEDPSQAPDSGDHRGSEEGISCGDGVDPPEQALHEGVREVVHVESGFSGTDYRGDFDIAAWVKEPARTSVFAWVDHNDDDVWQQSEPFDVLLYREDTTIETEVWTSKEPGGVGVVIGGELDGVTGCSISRPADVERRRSRSVPWRKAGETIVGSYHHRHYEVIKRATWFRVIAPPVQGQLPCKRAVSPPVRVRVPA